MDPSLAPLVSAIEARPAVASVLDAGYDAHGNWWIAFAIDIDDAEAWEEVRRFAWLFNNLYGAVAEEIGFRPVVVEDEGPGSGRHLCWQIESHGYAYTPERALDVLLTPLAPFEPPLGPPA